MMKLPLSLLLLIAGPYLTQVLADEKAPFQRDTLSSIMERAREDAQKLKLPANKHTTIGQQAAEQTTDTFHSPDFQKKVECEQQRLEQEVFKVYTQPWARQKQNPAPEQSANVSTEEIYLFFSSSVPVENIHSYITAIARAGSPSVIPVLHGFVNGMANMKASTEYFSRILKMEQACQDEMNPQKICQRHQVRIKVNPLLFTKYGITRVPAVVFVRGNETFKIQGDSGLDYLLERINREAKSPTMASLIKTIREKN